jgi:hypothetical protein
MGMHSSPTWWSSMLGLPRKDKIILSLTLFLGVALLVGLYVWGVSRSAPAAVASEVGTSAVDSATSDPAAVESGAAVPDGPAPDEPPYGLDVQAMFDEVRTHVPDLSDADKSKLARIANAAVARNVPDLWANDPEIRRDVVAQFPRFTLSQVNDVTRCLAELAERIIARNNGTVPPDSQQGEN